MNIKHKMKMKVIFTVLFVMIFSTGVIFASTTGLVSSWSFDEGSGSFAFDSAGDNDGTLHGAAWNVDRPPLHDNKFSLYFDGDDYVTVSEASNLDVNSITLTAWVKINFDNTVAQANIVRKGASGSGADRVYGLTVRNSGIVRGFVVLDSSLVLVDADGGTSMSKGVWHHIAMTYDGISAKVYIDGTLDHQSGMSMGTIADNDRDVFIGGMGSGGWNFKGKIDEVKIFNAALGAAAIKSLADTTPPELNLPENIVFNAMGAKAAVTFAATAVDDVDGNVNVVCTPSSGSVFYPGTTVVECTAKDANGNTSTGSFTVTVSSSFNGFFSPIDMEATNTVKAGSAIPIKFSMNGDKGLNIFETGYPKSEFTEEGNGGITPVIEETLSAGNSSLTYDSSSDQYTYVWKTSKSWAGTSRKLVLKFADQSYAPDVFFNFVK